MFNNINNLFNFNININIESEKHNNTNSIPINLSTLFQQVVNNGVKAYPFIFHQLLHRVSDLPTKIKLSKIQNVIPVIQVFRIEFYVANIDSILHDMKALEKDFNELYKNKFENLSHFQLQYWHNILSVNSIENVPKALFDRYNEFILSNTHSTKNHNIRKCMFNFYHYLNLEDKLAEAMTSYLKLIKIGSDIKWDEQTNLELLILYSKLCIFIGACPEIEMEKHQLALVSQYLNQVEAMYSRFYNSDSFYFFEAIEEIYTTIELSTGTLCDSESLLSHFKQAMRKENFSEALNLYTENHLRKHLLSKMRTLFMEEVHRYKEDASSLFCLYKQIQEMQEINTRLDFNPLLTIVYRCAQQLFKQQLLSGDFHSSSDGMLMAEIFENLKANNYDDPLDLWPLYFSPEIKEN